jgi:hypothetical protein
MKFINVKNIILLSLIILPFITIGVRMYRQSHSEVDTLTLKPHRTGPGGPAVEAFDNRNDRWIAEMEADSLEKSLELLTDWYEYELPGPMIENNFFPNFQTEEMLERTLYRLAVPYALSNRRFRKVLEDLKKLPPKKASAMLTQCIQTCLTEKRKLIQSEYVNIIIARGLQFDRLLPFTVVQDDGYYRPRTKPGVQLSQTAFRYGIFSYILLAAQLELRDVRPAIEDVVRQAKEEYALFESQDEKAEFFKLHILQESLYNPSILMTGTLCDPAWNAKLKKQLSGKEKLVTKEIVDYRARTTEDEWLGHEGWVPVEPFKSKLKVRYYQKITNEEFNIAFP